MAECSLEQCSCGKCRLLVGESFTAVLDAVEKNLQEFDFNIAAMAGTRYEIIREYVTWKPHVILLDPDLPGGAAFDALKQLRKVNPNVQVLLLTDKPTRESVLLAKKFGARDFILKNASPERLRATIRTVCPIRQARIETEENVDQVIDRFVADLDKKLFPNVPDEVPPE